MQNPFGLLRPNTDAKWGHFFGPGSTSFNLIVLLTVDAFQSIRMSLTVIFKLFMDFLLIYSGVTFLLKAYYLTVYWVL